MAITNTDTHGLLGTVWVVGVGSWDLPGCPDSQAGSSPSRPPCPWCLLLGTGHYLLRRTVGVATTVITIWLITDSPGKWTIIVRTITREPSNRRMFLFSPIIPVVSPTLMAVRAMIFGPLVVNTPSHWRSRTGWRCPFEGGVNRVVQPSRTHALP